MSSRVDLTSKLISGRPPFFWTVLLFFGTGGTGRVLMVFLKRLCADRRPDLSPLPREEARVNRP